ncbi:hypothetical protein [Nannocystis bainbridge]|uniref:Tryptophan synthase alpha chain n=1 Tax=Nannocystis bainbridge TaxID=2995303 RepID=A0ABT5EE51_9BACT|nr:hypothetical protein [Nannocystis bainbridge]MDC0723695.1 hypothetical protein [Nannocystis bainbridge]
MATLKTLQHLTIAAGLLTGCGERSGSTTDAGDAMSSASATAMEASTTTTTGMLPDTTAGVTTTAVTGSEDGCLGDADCAPDQCVGPTDEVCPQCLPTALQCAHDLDCAPGDVCIEFPEPCSCDTPFTTICSPPCNTSADCEAGGVCDLGSKHCLYDPCVGDEDCPPLFACVPGLGGDACRRRRCDSDADCGDAICIDGLCHAAPGTCIPEV